MRTGLLPSWVPSEGHNDTAQRDPKTEGESPWGSGGRKAHRAENASPRGREKAALIGAGGGKDLSSDPASATSVWSCVSGPLL